MRWWVVVLALLVSWPVRAEGIQIGVSREAIGIESNFSGARMAVFGAIDGANDLSLERGAYDIVVTMSGPTRDVVVRQKERRLGIWLNGAAQTFGSVPSFYAVASTKPLADIPGAFQARLSPERLQVGFRNTLAPTPEQITFAKSLVRLRTAEGLFHLGEGDVQFLSPTLFRATYALPANVPVGTHLVEAYLFRDGAVVGRASSQLVVEKRGFEQATYNLAYDHGLLYGLLAVAMAVLTGWLASVVFRRD